MKGKKCIKFLLSFIILALSFVLYSKDTNAIQGLEFEGTRVLSDNLCPFQTTYDNGNVVPEGTCSSISPSTGNVRNFRKSNFNVEKDKIYEIQVQLLQFNSTTGKYPYFRFPAQTNQDFQIVGVDYYETGGEYSKAITPCQNLFIAGSEVWCQYTGDYYSFSGTYSIYVKALRDNNYLRIGMASDGVILYQVGESSGFPIRFSSVVNVYSPSSASQMNNKDDQDRDNLEEQSSTASSDSDSSAEEAEQAGTTLLGAFSAFVNALTNASPSNCVLDMDLGNLDMGNVDFCQLSPPAGFQAIASVFMILFCVPLSIATARKLISLFRSFQ